MVARTRAGVLAFGADADVRLAFNAYSITYFDLHTIEAKKLRHDSGERGLLQDALAAAIGRSRSLTVVRKGSSDLLRPKLPGDSCWAALKKLVGNLQAGFPVRLICNGMRDWRLECSGQTIDYG